MGRKVSKIEGGVYAKSFSHGEELVIVKKKIDARMLYGDMSLIFQNREQWTSLRRKVIFSGLMVN